MIRSKQIGLVVALLGSIWSLQKCPKCQEHSITIAKTGVAGYASLLSADITNKNQQLEVYINNIIKMSSAIHVSLLTYMLCHRYICKPCVVTALGSFIALAAIQ